MSTKVTDLTALTTTPEDGDELHIVDVSDTTGTAAGTSKRIDVSVLMGKAPVQSVNGSDGTVVLDIEDLDNVTTATPSNGNVLNWQTNQWTLDTRLTTLYTEFRGGTTTDVQNGALTNSKLELTATTAKIKTGVTEVALTETSPGEIDFIVAAGTSGNETAFTAVEINGQGIANNAFFDVKTGTRLRIESSGNDFATLQNSATADTVITLPTSTGTLALTSEIPAAAPVDSVNTQTGAVVLDTGDIAESGNLYYTEARVSANSSVAANTAKISYTDASAVAANTLKNTYPSGDATKLAGIETGADVTDAANVASAGALMAASAQLTGDLDTQTNEIKTTTSNGNVIIAPDGTGVLEVKGDTNDAAIQLNCNINTHGVKIQAPPHSAAANYTLVLPDDTGTNGQVLTTDGSGNLSFTTVSGGGGGGVTVNSQAANRLVACSSSTDVLDGEANLTFNGSTLSVTGAITTTGQLSGNGSSVAVSKLETSIGGASSAGDLGLNAEVVTITTTTGLSAGYVYYLGASAWTSAVATSVAAASGMMAVATGTSSADGMCIRGIVCVATALGGSIGDVVYLSTATGRMTTTAVSSTGNVNRVMGYKVASYKMFFNPSQEWIEIS